MKIVLATDGSEHSLAAIEEIANRPFPANTEVRIVSAFESYSRYLYAPFPVSGSENYAEEIKFTAKKNAEEALETAVKIIADRNPELLLTTEVLYGSPKDVILEAADAFGADLIVVGAHGQGALERFLLGSVSQAVALHAKCSVEIVRKRSA